MKNSLIARYPNIDAAIRRGISVILAIGMVGIPSLTGEESDREGSALIETQNVPDSAGMLDFAELIENSPFLRPLDLSRTLVLTGFARIDEVVFAILLDRDSNESHFVSGSAGPEGWQLLGIDGDFEDLESVVARVSVSGGGVIYVRYDPGQLNPEPGGLRGRAAIPKDQAARIAHEARNFRSGLSSDGFPNAPPREVADKFGKLNEDQRGRIIFQMNEIRRKGVGGEERQKIFVRMIDGALKQRR